MLGDQRMEIYENPSEHYAAVRQLRESDNERERSVQIIINLKCCISLLILRSRSCASSSGTGSSRASRGVTSHGLSSEPAAASGPPVNFYGYGMCHLRLSKREERRGSCAQDSLFPNSVQRAEPDINTRFLSSENLTPIP